MKELDVYAKCDVRNFEPELRFCHGGFWTIYGLEKLKYLTYFEFTYKDNDSVLCIRIFRTSDTSYQKSLVSQEGFCDCGYRIKKDWKPNDHFILTDSKSGKYGAYELSEEEFTNVMYDVTKVFKKYMSENLENAIDKEHYNIKFRTDDDKLYDDGWNFLKIGSEFTKGIEEIVDRFPGRKINPKPKKHPVSSEDFGDLDLPEFLRRE